MIKQCLGGNFTRDRCKVLRLASFHSEVEENKECGKIRA
jgi:hypothetical protein